MDVEFDQDRLENIKAWLRVIASVAHDFRTPLLSMNTTGVLLEKHFSTFKKSYELAIQQGLIEPLISERDLKSLDCLLPYLKQDTTKLLQKISVIQDESTLLNPKDMGEVRSIKTYIDELLEKYPFKNDEERALVHVDIKQDFQVKCAHIFVESLLYNLLSNALKAITKAGKGELTICTDVQDNFNILCFKDTGAGISEYSLPAVFNHLESELPNGEKMPGLCICRLAIVTNGGKLLCSSKEKEHTEFIMKLPAA